LKRAVEDLEVKTVDLEKQDLTLNTDGNTGRLRF
jgi:hypothetical protein